jgi:hypothetical protein
MKAQGVWQGQEAISGVDCKYNTESLMRFIVQT